MQKIPKHIKPNIKVYPDLTEDNLGYNINNNITDDDIYYHWGLKLTKGVEEKPMYKSQKRSLMQNATREEIISYAKKNCRPILPDSEEYIPRKYWCKLEELQGENLRLLSHPVFLLAQEYIEENFKPSSTNLIVQACSNIKPYIDNISYMYTKQRHNEGYCDVVVNSCVLVPLEFTIYYPFRHYDWSHLRETELVTKLLIRKNFESIVYFVNKFEYKKVILLGPPSPDTFYPTLYKMLCKEYEGTDIEVHFVLDEDTVEKCYSTMNTPSWGILKSRYYNYFPVRDRIDFLIGVPNQDTRPRISKKDIRQKLIEGVSVEELVSNFNVEERYIKFIKSEIQSKLKKENNTQKISIKNKILIK